MNTANAPEVLCCGRKGWFVLDACGIVCVGIALFVISATDWIVSSIIILPWFGYTLRGLILLLFMHLFAGMSFVCHLRVMFTCPGVRPRGVLSEEELSRYLDRTTFDSGTRVCRHCKTFKTERMHHCRTCNRCVVNMDHHCPWVNNCVGEMYATVLLLMRGISCMYESQSCEDTMGSAGPLLGVLALIVSAFFLIFVCTMFCEQFDAIRDGLSEIDRLQHRPKRDVTLRESLEGVFGEPFSYRWFLPFAYGKILHQKSLD